ncbi:MAG: response regulator transcription factor [Pseudobacteriovorax sp.]|nr:response regulator transcription factor [Pseudobacteriovorax sp.]
MSKLLIVEDDPIILDGLIQALEAENFDVIAAQNGDDGLYKIRTESPDLVILDIMMPGLNGFEITTELRRSGDPVPIIVLSARSASDDKVKGFELGADDYVTKPFDLKVLIARIRRFLKKQDDRHSSFGNFRYNWQQRRLFKADQGIELTSKERLVLELFLNRTNQILNRDQILDSVWGSDYEGTDRTVDNVIVSLRKKIGSDHLRTERGLGYRFVTEP